MGKSIAWVVIAAALGGFGAGWLVFGSRSPAPVPSPPVRAVSTPPQAPRAAHHEFPLRPEDVQADRETPAIAVDRDGRILLAWASQTGAAERTLYLARSEDGGRTFDGPNPWRKVPIYRFTSTSRGKGKAKAMTFSTHVLPRLVSTGDGFVLGWVEAIDGGPNVAYFVARSTDGGRTFSEPTRVHGDAALRPGFTALAAGPGGSLLTAWLDGRDRSQQPFASRKPAESDGFAPEQLVYAGPNDHGICPCCDLAIAESSEGTRFVAFRNSADGHRDIWLARSDPATGRFQPPDPVTSSHWKFDGCPHDGPSLLVAGDRLHLAWMDASDGTNRVYYAESPANDLRFRPRLLNANSARSQGHPRLVADRAGRLLAVWDEALDDASRAPASQDHGHGTSHGPDLSGGGRAILYAAARDGSFGPPRTIDSRPGAFQLHPAAAFGPGGEAYVVWTELDGSGKWIRFARLNDTQARPKTEPAASRGTSTPTHARGRLLYQVHCARCHGASGHGDGPDAAALRPAPRDFASTHWRFDPSHETIRKVTRDGIPGTAMTAWSPLLSPSELDLVVAYVQTLSGGVKEPATTRVSARPVLSGDISEALGFISSGAPNPAPDLVLHDLDGTTHSLAEWRGRLTLLVFGGTSCAPCLDELPALERLASGLGPRGLSVVPVWVDESDPSTVRRTTSGRVKDLSVYVSRDPSAALRYDAQVLPTAVLIDRDGSILGRVRGAAHWDGAAARQLITAYLDTPAQQGGE